MLVTAMASQGFGSRGFVSRPWAISPSCCRAKILEMIQSIGTDIIYCLDMRMVPMWLVRICECHSIVTVRVTGET
jgi:hypothetical protein